MFIQKWAESFFNCNRYSTSRGLVWDSFKTALRGGGIISYTARIRNQEKLEIDNKIARLAELEAKHVTLIGQGNTEAELSSHMSKIAVAKTDINSYFQEKVAQTYQASRSDLYEYGETTGKVLAHRIRQKSVRNNILKIKDDQNQIVEGPEQILEVFAEFYK